MEKRQIYAKVRKTLNENIATNVSKRNKSGGRATKQQYGKTQQHQNMNAYMYYQQQQQQHYGAQQQHQQQQSSMELMQSAAYWNGVIVPQQGVNPYATMQQTKMQQYKQNDAQQLHTRNFQEQLNYQRQGNQNDMFAYIEQQGMHVQNQYAQFGKQQATAYTQQYQALQQTKQQQHKATKKLTREERRAKLRGYSLVKSNNHRNYNKKPISGQITPHLLSQQQQQQPIHTASGIYRNYTSHQQQPPPEVVQFLVDGVLNLGTIQQQQQQQQQGGDSFHKSPQKAFMVSIRGRDGNSYVRDKRSIGYNGILPESLSLDEMEKAIQQQIESVKEEQVEAVWKKILMSKEAKVTEEEMAEILFKDCTEQVNVMAAHRILQQCPYFKSQGNATFKCRSMHDVRESKKLKVEMQEQQQLMASLVSVMIDQLQKEEPSKDFEKRLSVEQQELMDQLKKYAMRLHRDPKLCEGVIEPLQLNPEEPSEMYQVLYKLGVFQYENPYFTRSQYYKTPYSSTEYATEVMEEAEKFLSTPQQDQDEHIRVNMMHLKNIAIDSSDTTEVDDAIAVEMLPNGSVKHYVNIADVSRVVDHNSKLDLAARKRSTTVYLPEKVCTMFPKNLADNVLSLVTNGPNYAMTFCTQIDADGQIVDYEVFPSRLQPVIRLTYEQVDAILKQPDHEHYEELSLMFSSANKRYHQRSKYSTNQLFLPSSKVRVDYPDGEHTPAHISFEPQKMISSSRRIVEEYMILANEVTSLFTNDHQIPVAYRGVLRNDEAYASFNSSMPKLDVDLSIPKDDYTEKEKMDLVLSSLTSKYPTRACTSELPLPHAGLGIQSYVQVTSPIRRYADLLVHHQIKAFLRKKTPTPWSEMNKQFGSVDTTSRAAGVLARDSERFWLYQYLKKLSQEKSVFRAFVMSSEEKPSGQYSAMCYLFDTQHRARILLDRPVAVKDIVYLTIDSISPHHAHCQYSLVE